LRRTQSGIDRPKIPLRSVSTPPLRANPSHDPLELRDIAEIGAGSGASRGFLVARLGLALVLASGICHVPYRTALLSQLMIQSARPRKMGRDARGQPPLGEGASDGGKKATHGR
jgi:hypothetical protein